MIFETIISEALPACNASQARLAWRAGNQLSLSRQRRRLVPPTAVAYPAFAGLMAST